MRSRNLVFKLKLSIAKVIHKLDLFSPLSFGVHHVAEALAHFEDVHHGVRAVAAAAAAFGAAQHVGAHLDDVHDGATSAVPAERQSDEGASINDVRKIFF